MLAAVGPLAIRDMNGDPPGSITSLSYAANPSITL
jgi:hypothetical protein